MIILIIREDGHECVCGLLIVSFVDFVGVSLISDRLITWGDEVRNDDISQQIKSHILIDKKQAVNKRQLYNFFF